MPTVDPGKAGIEELYDLLRDIAVDILALKGTGVYSACLRPKELRTLLKSLPNLKTLKLLDWHMPGDYLQALKRSRAQRQGDAPRSFPELDELHLVDVKLWGTTALKSLVLSHSLRKIAFKGFLMNTIVEVDPTGLEVEEKWGPITHDYQIVKWPKRTLQQFCLVSSSSEDEDLAQHVWRLW